MPARLSDDDFRELYQFRHAIRRFLHFSEQAARSSGLEPQQHQLLLMVRAQPGACMRITDIASGLFIKHHSAVELVDRTIRQGLVRRQRSEHDRREVIVSLTPEGERVLRELSIPHREELQRLAPELAVTLEAILRRADRHEAAEVAHP